MAAKRRNAETEAAEAAFVLPDHAESITRAFAGTEAFQRVREAIDERDLNVVGIERLRTALLAAMIDEYSGDLAAANAGGQYLIITPTGREADVLLRALRELLPEASVQELPAWETLPHERLSPSPQVTGQRLEVLRSLADWRDARGAGGEADAASSSEQTPAAEGGAAAAQPQVQIVIASVRAALQPVADNLASIRPLHVAVGEDHPLEEFATRLVEMAYARVDLVTRRGEFTVRGGIIDVFPPTADYPVRIELFGDEVDTIKPFHVADQRTDEQQLDQVDIGASRELLLTEHVRQRAAEMQHEFPNLSGMLEKLSQGIPVEGMESLAPALDDHLVPITDYLARDAVVAVVSPERARTRAENLVATNREFLEAAWSAAVAGAEAPIDLSAGEYLDLDALRKAASPRHWWQLSPFDSEIAGADTGGADAADAPAGSVPVVARAVPSFAGDANGAVEHVRALLSDGWRVVITAAAKGTAARTMQLLADQEVAARAASAGAIEAGVASILVADVDEGWELADERLALITEAEFFGRTASYNRGQPKKLASRRRKTVDPLQLKPGDLVVHDKHGIGRFIELTSREVGGRDGRHLREYLVIEYAPSKKGHPGDRLYVPTDQLDQLTRYVGGEDPTLSKLGGSDWSRTKSKARKAVREIAVGLVKLYAERTRAKGHAFGPDTPWQHELEEAFPYAETPDQLQTIDEVKHDMEREMPMDRLLAGDVGFGKTEVAVRAAFKAIQDGYQVAMLVPTTLLAQQHAETFAERYAGFPVKLRTLSRFQTAKETADTIAGLADGSVDMVIGTHRILSKSVHFKKIGLVIIDEEQRFGVEHKERLKELKTNVDVLSMSATPIPRTLEMAVTGIREMSTLATPPESRHPVLTYVGAFSDKQVAAAVRRELLREGQVFYVHNRVGDIAKAAAHIAELVPEARVGVAHGQMGESELERVIVDFWEQKFDVLVSTTIIETGMDIQNANTLIVDDAQRYGLSQLHQLRGRVGRGRERAYAYFLYDPEKTLTDTAHDRLETIAANNELGAGMQVAMKDLELRGAGNLLGGEQSGHIAGVGFDLYLRMVGEAVDAFKGGDTAEQIELRLELPVDAHIPTDYVDSERLRLEAYQKLATASSPTGRDGAIDAVVEEFEDRYGRLPLPVRNLISVSRLRRALAGSGLAEVIAVSGRLRLAPLELSDSLQMRLRRLYGSYTMLPAGGGALITVPEELLGLDDVQPLVDWVTGVLVSLEVIEAPVAAAIESSDAGAESSGVGTGGSAGGVGAPSGAGVGAESGAAGQTGSRRGTGSARTSARRTDSGDSASKGSRAAGAGRQGRSASAASRSSEAGSASETHAQTSAHGEAGESGASASSASDRDSGVARPQTFEERAAARRAAADARARERRARRRKADDF
nr:transcription-repair coupling factor [Pseudoclavibacter sp. CFCC 13611]